MKNSIVIVILLIAGISHNAYAMDLTDQQKSNEQRKPLSRQPTAEELYPESRLYIQQEKAEAYKQSFEKAYKQSFEKAYKQSFEEGRLKVRLEAAANLLKMGMPEEQILKATQLTPEQFATLQQQKKSMEE